MCLVKKGIQNRIIIILMSDFSSSSPLSVGDRASLKPKKIFEIRTEKGYKENSKNELTTKIENIKK